MIIFISFFGCAPITIKKTKKPSIEEEIKAQKEKAITQLVKPENKIIDFNNIEKVVAILSDESLLTPIFL